MTIKTINPTQACAKHKLPLSRFQSIMRKAKVEPLYQAPYGKGVMHFYDEAAVAAAVEAAAPKRKVETPSPAPTNNSAVSDAAIKLLGTVATGVSTVLDGLDKIVEKLNQVSAQNAALLKAIEKTNLDISARINSLQETTDALKEEATAVVPKPAPLVKPAVVTRKRVMIVGLLANQVQLIDKEFGKEFDLRFVSIDDAKGKDFRSAALNCEAIFTMTNFINHSVEDTIKALNGRLIRVTGGMTSLRSLLTETYLKQGAEHGV